MMWLLMNNCDFWMRCRWSLKLASVVPKKSEKHLRVFLSMQSKWILLCLHVNSIGVDGVCSHPLHCLICQQCKHVQSHILSSDILLAIYLKFYFQWLVDDVLIKKKKKVCWCINYLQWSNSVLFVNFRLKRHWEE